MYTVVPPSKVPQYFCICKKKLSLAFFAIEIWSSVSSLFSLLNILIIVFRATANYALCHVIKKIISVHIKSFSLNILELVLTF